MDSANNKLDNAISKLNSKLAKFKFYGDYFRNSWCIHILVIWIIFSTKAKKRFENKQRTKGLIKFIDRLGNEKWGTLQQVKTWEKEDKETELKESIFYRVIKSIEGFEPSRRYRNEFGYHTELQGWLKAQFPSAKVEIQTGSSRPDIVIDNIAVEVKGLTDNRALDTLSTKCLKYLNYYSHLVIVLFESNFSEGHYNEIVKGIENYSPNVRIIRKN